MKRKVLAISILVCVAIIGLVALSYNSDGKTDTEKEEPNMIFEMMDCDSEIIIESQPFAGGIDRFFLHNMRIKNLTGKELLQVSIPYEIYDKDGNPIRTYDGLVTDIRIGDNKEFTIGLKHLIHEDEINGDSYAIIRGLEYIESESGELKTCNLLEEMTLPINNRE